MKQITKPKSAAFLALLLGIAAAAARGLLYLLAVDEKGLLVHGHPLGLLLGVLSVAAVVPACMQLSGKKASGKLEDNFASGMAGAAGCAAMAAGIALTLLEGNDLLRSNLVLLWNVSGILACLGLLWAALSRAKGKKSFLLVPALVCLFLGLHMVSRYQSWSGEPQAMDWVFSLLGAVGLTLCAYQLAAFSADAGHRRSFLAEGGLTVFFCCAALPHTDYFWLYLGGLVWVLTTLWEMTAPVPVQPREEG